MRINVPKLIGRFAFLIGIFDILVNILRPFRAPAKKLNALVPVYVNSTAFVTAVFTGVILIILSRGLIRRKRRAWYLAILMLLTNMATDLFRYRYHPVQISFMAALLLCLVIFRKQFSAISDSTTKWAPLWAFVGSVAIVIPMGLLIIYYRHKDQIVGNPTFKNVLLTVVEGLIGIAGPVQFANERVTDTVAFSLGALGFFTLVVPLWLFFRRVKPLKTMGEEDIRNVHELIMRDEEQDSLSFFATRRDKSVIYSQNKKAGIAYRVQSGVMLASGDPFGEYSLWPEAIANFITLANAHGWTPAVMGASEEGGEVWVEHADMLALEIGDEAIIDVKDFTLEGRPMANVRQMVNRIKRKGYEAHSCRWSELDSQTARELQELAKKWRYGVPERGFSMSMDRMGETGLDDNCVITTVKLEGKIVGLLYFVPWGKTRISLDRMQRERGTDPGVNELLIVNTVEYAKENQISHISLNFAAFRSLFERAEKISAGPLIRTMRNILRFFSNWFQVESLYRFNAKFQPEWRTRYVLYPGTTELVKVGWAALRAEKFISSFRTHSIRNQESRKLPEQAIQGQ